MSSMPAEPVIPDNLYQSKALDMIVAERARQDSKWGEQNHTPVEWIAILGEEYGEASQGALRSHFGGRTKQEYAEELVQVAAVAVAALECLLRGGEMVTP